MIIGRIIMIFCIRLKYFCCPIMMELFSKYAEIFEFIEYDL